MSHTATRAVITRAGPPDVIGFVDEPVSALGLNDVLVRHTAIGVNYLDVQQRKGSAPLPLPSGLGFEAAGTVVDVGSEVDGFKFGDRVAYAAGAIGAYANLRVCPPERLLRLPDSLSDTAVTSALFKGITAQYLLTATYPVGPGTRILLYGVSGSVGQIMARWAKHMGALVIGVASESNAHLARSAGCDAVIASTQDIAAEVRRITEGAMVDVVYDSIGAETFEASLHSLRPRGLFVSFGAASGPPPALEFSTLNALGSLFATRPSIFAHTRAADEYRRRASAVLGALAGGVFAAPLGDAYPMRQAGEAHRAIEARQARGATLLIPEG